MAIRLKSASTAFTAHHSRVNRNDTPSVQRKPERRASKTPGFAEPARPDWSTIGTGGHGVQFYADDTALVELLARHVGTALVCGDAAVVVAAADRHAALDSALSRRGFSLEVARSEGRYVPVDAQAAFDRLLVNGVPDRDRFNQIAGAAVDRAAAAVGRSRARVAVYGELVALLWAKGYPKAALRVEEFWNELARTRHFSLCCAYPMKGFGAQTDAAPIMKICAQHSHVFPVERRMAPRSV